MKKWSVAIFLVLFIISACSSNQNQESQEEEQDDTGVEDSQPVGEKSSKTDLTVLADNLDVPWSITKHENAFYITERPGGIVKIENEEMERQTISLKKDQSDAAEAGLLGFVLASDFSESNLAYGYYTYESESGQFNRVVTLRLSSDGWQEEEVLIDEIPSGTYHHGGRLEIGPDDKLYVTTGDASNAEIAQDLNSLGGKILRMDLDGSIPEDNPDPDSYVYSYGHRNPQGVAWTPSGELYASEHGNSANDEINKIEAGGNYGWPIIEGNQEQENMVSPLFTSGDDTTWAPSGMSYSEEKLYVAALSGTAVLEFDLETNQYKEVVTGLGRIRDVAIEDDYLYFISNNTDGRGSAEANDDKLYRIAMSELD
ncbi:PQQ-dependent sugar dehydrogenase [Gracilibacillus kekensis]|uniref:Glucose/arabinose dehydrogenase, beta-propeller fold n=1 Tax=Gracilibacillus kekensis TaxID=1027249 RepID=A0A1M7QAF7_9BACI|nr:sorbosone dehydrogenase family protein [Gracilibacillus kekensis]SHN27603.1 Glucose/arabinose dehydrogenase, beta-propeller fold [Gracilibacillus kekensis]